VSATSRGGSAHRLYQQAHRDAPGFEAEVPLQDRFELRDEATGDVVELRGRADVLYRTGSGAWILEELKTGGSATAREVARCQVEVYAELLLRRRGLECRPEVVWLDSAGEEICRETVDPSRRATRRERMAVALGRLSARRHRAHSRTVRWRELEERLEPPYPHWRAAQRTMREEVAAALTERSQLLVEAPTGAGKSAALLEPALRHALREGQQLYALTPRKTQQHGILSLLRHMLPPALPTALQRAAVGGLCHLGLGACAPQRCERAADPVPDDPLERLASTRSVAAKSDLLQAFETSAHCAYWSTRRLSHELPVVVADYDVLLRGEFALGPDEPGPAPILLIDEIHQLPDRARSHWRAELDGELLNACEQSLDLLASKAAASLRSAAAALRDGLNSIVECADPDVSGIAPDAFDPSQLAAELSAFDDACWRAVDALYAGAVPGAEEPWIAAWRAAGELRRECSAGDRGFVPVAFRRPSGAPVVGLWCVDPAPRLRGLFARAATVIGCSATLPGGDAPEAQLGFDPDRCGLLRIPELRDPERRRIALDARFGTRLRERERETPRIAAAIRSWVEATAGHALILAPSFAWLAALERELAPHLRLRVQQPDDSDERRHDHEGAIALHAPATCLLAVAGGALAEGLDYGGGALSLVIAVGPPVPPPTPLRALLLRDSEERGDDGFARVFADPAIRAVRQGAGRLWRSEDDSGQLVLLGRRFSRAPYWELLPECWRAELSVEGD
jgi:DNA excision repair protein ERCC-2